MIRIPPSVRISLGLMFITLSLVMLAHLIGLIPDETILVMEARKSISESLAAQLILPVQNNNFSAAKKTMDSIVDLNSDIISLGIRDTERKYLAQTESHHIHWVIPSGKDSTFNHWQVPIYTGEKSWATLELSFAPQNALFLPGYKSSPFVLLIAFFALMSFIVYLIYMNRILRHLDPSTVVPRRVKYALDTLTEGVILVDKKDRIVLANSAYAEKLGCTVEALLGLKASELNWINPKTNRPSDMFPWLQAMEQGEIQSSIPLNFTTRFQGVRSFMVNSAPIIDDSGIGLGALATFDDVTELEQKNIKLSETIEELQQSRATVEAQNKELEILATQDPLTGCLNRRSFFEKAEQYYMEAATNGRRRNLACIMLDIDKFKSINDRYGHSIGDQVILFVAAVLQTVVRGDDLVCRYGGEEFCILLPHCDTENAATIAHKMLDRIRAQSAHALSEAKGIYVTASFGVSDITTGANSIEALISQTDRALYKAKESGRNRVVS